MKFLKRCWAEISLENIRYNLTQYKKLIPEGAELMCVVKASCYGHGDGLIAPFLQEELGVKYFAVSNILEGERLRSEGIDGDILILGYTPPEYADELVKYDIIQACTELSYAEELSRSCTCGKVRIHAAVDTGMTRIGFYGMAEEICGEIAAVGQLENILLEGIFTHYACADGCDPSEEEYTRCQTEKFNAVYDGLTKRGVKLIHSHSLNSAGGAYGFNDRSTLVRLGIILYGLYPDPKKPLPFEPRPVMTLKSSVSQVKYIEPGTCVSYGRTFTADRKMKLATVTAGYADGYPRALSNKGEVIIGGKRCRILGRVCMDQFMCDVSGLSDVKAGDEVILMNGEITADDIAGMIGTIGYEVTCGITERVPRTASQSRTASQPRTASQSRTVTE
ncbi:MAG: alanine racemase [Ruminococcus sp.]|nr:alanine racemase [Ruminococcus sp.]